MATPQVPQPPSKKDGPAQLPHPKLPSLYLRKGLVGGAEVK
jgi:hypothetical protein